MTHVVLLGDSICESGSYTGGAPDVGVQLRRRLPQGSEATLGAGDGGMIGDIGGQLQRLPADATHLVLSVGGNDALMSADFLAAPVRSAGEALLGLADIGDAFEGGYLAMLEEVLAYGLPTAVCTVYYPRFAEATFQRMAVAGLTVFNDCIVRAAFARGLPLVDLRLICTEGEDYANPIEPSVRGGEKIARAVVTLVEHGSCGGRTEVFA